MSLPNKKRKAIPAEAVDSDNDKPLREDKYKQVKYFSDPAIDCKMAEISEACVKVINTPEFNRLHEIKQTGCCYLVFPSATHTRFAHSLGTCHLAGELLNRLKGQQPELNITDRDTLAVCLAALCHDLGHGALSHTFDQLFIPLAVPGSKWKHEDASKMMFRHLLAKNPDVKAYLDGILKEEDYSFIEEAITSVEETPGAEWPYKGRPIEKAFLYDIVANKTHGFDVDKWDYIVRDAKQMAVATCANIPRLLKNIEVLPVGRFQRPTICYRDKVRQDLYNLGATRKQLHESAYQHSTVKVLEVMIVDVLLIADKHLRFPGKGGASKHLSETINDMEAYSHVTDDIVFGHIRRSTDEKLKSARDIIDRIMRRRLYAKVGQVNLNTIEQCQNHKQSGICTKASIEIAMQLRHCRDRYPRVDEEQLQNNVAVIVSDIHCGMQDKNPLDKVWFFLKDHLPFRKRDLDLHGPPRRRKIIRVFCRTDEEEFIECARACFEIWCMENDLPSPREMHDEARDVDDDEVQYASQPNSMQKVPNGRSASPDGAQRDAVRKDLEAHPFFCNK